MLPTARLQSTGREKLNLVERVQQAIDRVPFPQRIVPILGAVLFLCPVLAPVAVVTKSRTKMATAYVAMLSIWLIYVFGLYSSDPAALPSAPVRWSLLALPVIMAVIAHLRAAEPLVRAVPDRGGDAGVAGGVRRRAAQAAAAPAHLGGGRRGRRVAARRDSAGLADG